MKTRIIKRSIVLDGHKTSVSLENEFWDGLLEIARHEKMTISVLVKGIADSRTSDNLSSAIRMFVFNHFRTRGWEAPLASRNKVGESRGYVPDPV